MNIYTLSNKIKTSRKIVVVCGAGISTAAGIDDFKTAYKHNPNLKKALTKNTYTKHQEILAKFVLSFYTNVYQPTITHKFLKYLEDSKKLRRCYTMNVDNLEIISGINPNLVRQLHGNVTNGGRCGSQKLSKDNFQKIVLNNSYIQYSKTHNCILRPNIVMYGENVKETDDIFTDFTYADLILCIGTTLKVQPIADVVKNFEKKVIVINNELLPYFSQQITKDCDHVFEKIMSHTQL